MRRRYGDILTRISVWLPVIAVIAIVAFGILVSRWSGTIECDGVESGVLQALAFVGSAVPFAAILLAIAGLALGTSRKIHALLAITSSSVVEVVVLVVLAYGLYGCND